MGDICVRVSRNIQMPLSSEYTQRQVVQFLQRAYEHIWSSKPWPQTLTDELTATIAANTNYVVIPKLYQSIVRAYDDRGRDIRIVGTMEYADFTQLEARTDTNLRYLSPFGYQGVLTQMSTTEAVKVISDSATDATANAISVTLRGLNSVGELIAQTATVNGTTGVAFSASNSRIDSVGKNKSTVGTISITNNAGSATYATIGPNEGSPKYPRYRANITPSGAVTFNYIAKLRFVPFLNLNDYAIFDMDAALESKATELAHMEHRNVEAVQMWRATAMDDLDELVRREINSDGSVEIMAPMRRG